MKVAICLSGFPRTMDYSYPYFRKYFKEPLSPDIFFAGYEDKVHGISQSHIKEVYQPISSIIREYDKEVEREITNQYNGLEFHNISLQKGTPLDILSQYYNLFLSNQLKKDYEKKFNFTYDVVIRARTDYYFYKSLSAEELKIKHNTVYIPHLWNFGGVSSGFAYGSSAAMDLYSTLFYNLKNYNLKDGVKFHPETLKKYHITKQQLILKPIENHFWWDLKDFKINGHEDSYIEGHSTNPLRKKYR